jgi:hypothetical protein
MTRATGTIAYAAITPQERIAMPQPTENAPDQEEFAAGIRQILGDGRVVATVNTDKRNPGQIKLDDIGRRLLDTLDSLGRAIFKLETVRKDRGALPGVVSDAAIVRRQIEADANKLMNEYVAEVQRQQGGAS